MLKTQSLRFAYEDHTTFHFPDIDLGANQDLLILGESGIGKTTLLHLIAGLLKPASGTIDIEGTDITSLSTRRLDQFRGSNVGIVFQQPRFVHALSLKENLALAQYLAGKKQNMSRITEVLDRLGIAHKQDQKPNRLSQGERQRAAIALAIINQPKLILADEPTSSLDGTNCIKVTELLREQAAASDACLIIITHDQRLNALFQNTLKL